MVQSVLELFQVVEASREVMQGMTVQRGDLVERKAQTRAAHEVVGQAQLGCEEIVEDFPVGKALARLVQELHRLLESQEHQGLVQVQDRG
jgi:hypothetical protein